MPKESAVAVNQVGYTPEGRKVAYARGLTVSSFRVCIAGTDQAVYAADVAVGPLSCYGLTVHRLDFTSLRRPGRYVLVADDGTCSPVFAIGDAPYGDVVVKAARSYTLLRCGMALAERADGIEHAACHRRLAFIRADQTQTVDVSGGWHDAGDYGRYMQTAGVTVGQLLLLDTLARRTVSGTVLSLPDSLQGIPDLWIEARYELLWMLRMQRADGAVYHKVNTATFCGMVLPEDDTDQLLVYDVATPDTAIFAAAMARAARVYAPYDMHFAVRCRAAAEAAWTYLVTAPPFLTPPNDATGAYHTRSDADERLWAAVELYLTTGKEELRTYVSAHFDAVVACAEDVGPITWEDVSTLAVISLVLAPDLNWETQQRARQYLLAQAEILVERIARDPFHCALREQDYHWASAKEAVAYGVNLAVAYRLTGREAYLDGAQHQLHWVLGANPLALSFVTSVGEHAARHPHNRYSVATGRPFPGLLVGGPNAEGYQQDKITPKLPGPLAYVDQAPAYACNENAIDYNAPLTVLAATLQELTLH